MAGVMKTIVKGTKEEVEAEKELLMAVGRLEDYKKTAKLSPTLQQIFVKYDKVFCEFLRTRKHTAAMKLSEVDDSPLKAKEEELLHRHGETGRTLVRAIIADKTLPADIKSHAQSALEAYNRSQEILDNFEKDLEKKMAKN